MTEHIAVAPQPQAAEAASSVMSAGGNAVDAGIAGAFVQGVVDPVMCGIGGFGVLIYATPESRPIVLDFSSQAGALTQEGQWAGGYLGQSSDRFGYLVDGNVNEVGYASIGVPTTVAGLGLAHERWGTRAWDCLLAPAIKLAEEGFPVSEATADFWSRPSTEGRTDGPDRLRYTSASAAIYAPDGEPLQPGEYCVQSDYANTLRRIARYGWREFYEGETGDRIARDMAANGALVTHDDLRACQPPFVDPVISEYRGLQVFGAPPPSGGVLVAQMLAFLDAFDITNLRHGDPELIRLLVEAMKLARSTRARLGSDPNFTGVSTDAVLDSSYVSQAVAKVAAGGVLDADAVPHDDASTTHLITADGRGGVLSLTHSLGYSSGVVTPGLGFLYNNYMNCFNPLPGYPDSLAPGKRRESSVAPTIVYDERGAAIILGAPGATRIATAVVQVLVHLIDLGMCPLEAVSAARVDCQSGPVHLEGRIPYATEESLRRQGYEIVRHHVHYDRYFARPQVALRSSDGWRGASDPRGDGGVALVG